MSYAIAQEKIAQAKAEGWTELDLAGLELETLPPELWELEQLEVLLLGKTDEEGKTIGNKLQKLPDEIQNLTNLKLLNLYHNQLNTLPPELGNLTNLQEVNFNWNKLSSLPDTIGKLINLQVFELEGNELNSLPEEIGNLVNLEFLDLSSNQLSSLPETIGNLHNLRLLRLRHNHLSYLPDTIGQLINVQGLNLSENKLSRLPESILGLSNLEWLNVTSNPLSSLPDAIGNLHNLELLVLCNTQLSSLPDAIGRLLNLQSLNLSSNQLSSVPPKIGQLSNLQQLDLGGNQLSSLPPEIGQLSNLQQLDLWNNQLSSVLPEIGTLTNLKQLDLRNNQLNTFPPQVRELPQLETLNLYNCGIRTLPDWIQALPNLKSLDLRANPLPIPPELLGQKEWFRNPGDLQEILSFYFQTQTQTPDAHPLNEAKLLIIGEPGAGKTTLAQKFLNPDYELKEDEVSTEGIEVLPWEFSPGTGQPFRARIWDFGGQEIYHQTHQFFLSQRSLYILVADTRKEDTDFYYWLKTVNLLGGNSPVIIVKNEKQDRQRDINERQLRGEFLHLEKVFAVNLATGRGLPELVQYIQRCLTTLDHVGTPVPPAWSRVRAILENCTESRNTLDRSEYFEFCRQQGLTDTAEMLRISAYLHDLGICLHFQQDKVLKNLLMLKPEWGTKAAYQILDNTKVRNNLGHFTTADLAELWTKDYAPYQDELLELMQKFKLCYEIPRQPQHYIAPQLLSADQPCYLWDEAQNLRLRYCYEFMPKGIISRLIVELHEYIVYQEEQALVWKTGVVVTNGSALAEIQENYPQRTIDIRVRGNRQRDWLLPIAHELDKIHASYNSDLQEPGEERLKVEKLIPCNCDRCRTSADPEFYPKRVLDQYLDDRRPDIECRKSYDRVNVRRLLDDVVDELFYPDPQTLNRRGFFSLDREMGAPIMPSLPPPPQNPTLSTNAQGVTVIVQQNQENPTVSNPTQFQGDYVRGDKVMGDKVGRDKIGTQINNPSPNLVETVQLIKALLNELSEEYNPHTEKGQNLIKQEALQKLETDPTLKQRFLNALKEGGATAIEEMVDHPVVKPLVAAVKGFMDA